ncbi:MAG: hypothetical protein WCG87_11190, partial [Bacteroidota bacterium]
LNCASAPKSTTKAQQKHNKSTIKAQRKHNKSTIKTQSGKFLAPTHFSVTSTVKTELGLTSLGISPIFIYRP